MSFRALNAKPCRRIAVTSHATGHTLRRPAIASDRPGDSPIISAGHSCGIYFGTDRRDQFSGKAACSSSRLRLSRMRLADCLQALAVAKWPVEITPSWALRLPSSRSTLPRATFMAASHRDHPTRPIKDRCELLRTGLWLNHPAIGSPDTCISEPYLPLDYRRAK